MKHLTIFLLLLTSCAAFDPQAAMDRKNYRNKLKAEEKIQEAVLLDPSILTARVKTDTIVKYTDPAFGIGKQGYSQASMDSMLVICSTHVSNYRNQALSATGAKEAAERTVRRLRAVACGFDTITVLDGALEFKVWQNSDGLDWVYHLAAQKVEVVTHTPELKVEINPQQVEKPDARSGKVWWLLLLIAVVVLVVKYGRAIWGKVKNTWMP